MATYLVAILEAASDCGADAASRAGYEYAHGTFLSLSSVQGDDRGLGRATEAERQPVPNSGRGVELGGSLFVVPPDIALGKKRLKKAAPGHA